MNEMPAFLMDITTLINRMPASTCWRRLRIAMSTDELDQYRTWFSKEPQDNTDFIYAIKGVPIQVEEFPVNPLFTMERLDGTL